MSRTVTPIALPEGITPPVVDPAAWRKHVATSRDLGVPRDYARTRRLRAVREPAALQFIGYDTQQRPQWLHPHAARAWLSLRHAAALSQIEVQVVSAFRSVEYQVGIIRRKIERGLSMDEILRVSAAPGYSEHHSGRALDVTTPGFAALEEEFENSPAFAWMQRHAGDFGFVLSYPRDNPHRIAYEPWHWCWHAAR